MDLKNGDSVTLDGKPGKVVSQWGKGHGSIFTLDDGRQINNANVDTLIKNGTLVIGDSQKEVKPDRSKSRPSELDTLPPKDLNGPGINADL